MTTLAIPQLNKSQLSIVNHKTPPEFIKHRPGPGGMSLAYVEIGYVLGVLNEAFNYAWDFTVIEQQVGKRQVWVCGELVVYLSPTFQVRKGQYGGSDIKFNRNGDPISIADDLKAAASDCLKKCASMLGIAADVYFPQLDIDFSVYEDPPQVNHEVTPIPVETHVPVEVEDIDPTLCADHYLSGQEFRVNAAVQKFSRDKFGMTLCMSHQKDHQTV